MGTGTAILLHVAAHTHRTILPRHTAPAMATASRIRGQHRRGIPVTLLRAAVRDQPRTASTTTREPEWPVNITYFLSFAT